MVHHFPATGNNMRLIFQSILSNWRLLLPTIIILTRMDLNIYRLILDYRYENRVFAYTDGIPDNNNIIK